MRLVCLAVEGEKYCPAYDSGSGGKVARYALAHRDAGGQVAAIQRSAEKDPQFGRRRELPARVVHRVRTLHYTRYSLLQGTKQTRKFARSLRPLD